MKQLEALNKKEPRPIMILRLLAEAEAGVIHSVSIATALEFRRDQYGLSKTEFAGVLGLNLSHYGEVINGKKRLPLNSVRRAYAIGVPAEVLLQPE